MNWGKGIFITVTVFVIVTLSVVSYLISLDFYMVSNDHYDEASNYQETIDKKDRAKNLSQPVMVFFDEQQVSLKLVFPPELAGRNNTGTVHMYRPSDSNMDLMLDLNIDQQGVQFIDATNLAKGKWILKLDWSTDGKEYSDEKNILL